MLECADGTIYTGITNDLYNRMKMHADGTGAKYMRGRSPFVVLGTWTFPDRSEASKEEYRIKKLSKAQKLKFLVESV